MSRITAPFADLTPEAVFDANGPVDELAFENEILPYFDEYLDAMEDLGYAGLREEFGEEPATFSEFKHGLARLFAEEHPEWDPHDGEFPEVLPATKKETAALKLEFAKINVRYRVCRSDFADLDLAAATEPAFPGAGLFSDPAFRGEFAGLCSEIEGLAAHYEYEAGEGCFSAAAEIVREFGDRVEKLERILSKNIIAHIPTAADYDVFEKALLKESCTVKTCDNSPLSDRLLLDLRRYGRELHGVAAREESLEKKFGIAIETDDFSGMPKDLLAARTPVAGLGKDLAALEFMLKRYPPGFIASSGLKTLYLVSNLHQKNPDRKIFALTQGNVMAIEAIYASFDHELWHVLDFSDGPYDDDVAWALESHGPYFEADRIRSQKTDRHPGYVSDYAFTETVRRGHYCDDQAEIAEALMLAPGRLEKEAALDPVLAAKVAEIKASYYARSGGLMGERFWRDLEALPKAIDDDYWASRDAAETDPMDFFADQPGEDELDAVALREAVKAARQKGDWKSARDTALQLADLLPGDPWAPESAGDSAARAGDHAGAVAAYEEAVRRGGRGWPLFDGLALAYRGGAKDDTCWSFADPAREGFERLVALDFDNPQLYRALGKLYLDAGEPEKAMILHEKKILAQEAEGGSDSAYVYYYLEFLDAERERFQAAGERYGRTLDFAAAHLRLEEPYGAFYGAIDSLIALDRRTDATAILETESAQRPDDAYLRSVLASVKKDAAK